MDKINNIGLKYPINEVYEFNGYTQEEIFCLIAQKINILIEHFNYIDRKVENINERVNLISKRLDILENNI